MEWLIEPLINVGGKAAMDAGAETSIRRIDVNRTRPRPPGAETLLSSFPSKSPFLLTTYSHGTKQISLYQK